MSKETTLIRSVYRGESITVDGPAKITLGKSRQGRAVMIIRAPESTIITNDRKAKQSQRELAASA